MLNTYVVYVENKPGVLTRVASLFRRRAFNIDSLTVGRTEKPEVSRMTITVDADHDQARRIEANLYKLVNVLLVENITNAARDRPRPGDDQSRGYARSALARAGTGERVPRASGGRGARLADHRNHRRRRQDRRPCSKCCAPTACWRWCGPELWPCGAASLRRERRRPSPDEDVAEEDVSHSV